MFKKLIGFLFASVIFFHSPNTYSMGYDNFTEELAEYFDALLYGGVAHPDESDLIQAAQELKEKYTPLIWAITNREESEALRLLELENAINLEDKSEFEGATALALAAQKGLLKVVKKLLDLGANPNAKDNLGNTPLILATIYGHSDVVYELLIKKANPNLWNKFFDTSLMISAKLNNKLIAELLLAYGVDINLQINDKSALNFAASHGFNEIIFVLIRNNVDPTIKTSDGYLAWQIAEQNNNLETARIIKGYTLIFEAMQKSKKEGIVSSLLKSKADPNTKLNNQTALTIAASSQQNRPLMLDVEDNSADIATQFPETKRQERQRKREFEREYQQIAQQLFGLGLLAGMLVRKSGEIPEIKRSSLPKPIQDTSVRRQPKNGFVSRMQTEWEKVGMTEIEWRLRESGFFGPK